MTETDAEFVERFFSEAQERGWLVGEDRHRLRDIARRGAPMQWRPIEEAPKDGTEVLVYAWLNPPEKLHESVRDLPPYIGFTSYHPDAGWLVCEIREVTHFMQLPAPPTPKEDKT